MLGIRTEKSPSRLVGATYTRTALRQMATGSAVGGDKGYYRQLRRARPASKPPIRALQTSGLTHAQTACQLGDKTGAEDVLKASS